jgi:hypothetical protein
MADTQLTAGRRTRGRKTTLKTKTLRRMLKGKGLKTTGKKATLMKRLHKRGGGALSPHPFAPGGEDTMGPRSPAGNEGEPGIAYAKAVSKSLDQQGGRRRRRRSSSRSSSSSGSR